MTARSAVRWLRDLLRRAGISGRTLPLMKIRLDDSWRHLAGRGLKELARQPSLAALLVIKPPMAKIAANQPPRKTAVNSVPCWDCKTRPTTAALWWEIVQR